MSSITNSPYFWMTISVLAFVIAWVVVKIILPRWKSQRKRIQRRRVEDTLKLIFNLQEVGQAVDQYRLAIELKLSLKTTLKLISNLISLDLILTDMAHHLSLTSEGQRWALQVIRAHRLWERYLADEARMPLEQVHTAAHRHEHVMSVEVVNALDAAMGHPARDPHGDPIPNASGEMRDNRASLPLVKMTPGQRGQISHLEDEPALAYAQLLAEGLFVGQEIHVQEVTQDRVVLSSDGTEYTLAPSIAENVSIFPEEILHKPDASVISLDDLQSKNEAEIVRIDDRCQGFTRRRFLDLGLTPGTIIYPELENIFQDPRAYRVRGTLIALRKDQSNMIWVRPVKTGTAL